MGFECSVFKGSVQGGSFLPELYTLNTRITRGAKAMISVEANFKYIWLKITTHYGKLR